MWAMGYPEGILTVLPSSHPPAPNPVTLLLLMMSSQQAGTQVAIKITGDSELDAKSVSWIVALKRMC